MLIELSNGQKVDTESSAFLKLPEEMQRQLVAAQEKLVARRKAKALASQKCRALKNGLPWPPLVDEEGGASNVG